jgi:Zn-finger nucleic acid-binding protein
MIGAERRQQLGPGGHCVCPKCGIRIPHQEGVRCETEHCPRCAAGMLREGSRHHELWLAKHNPGRAGRPETDVTT